MSSLLVQDAIPKGVDDYVIVVFSKVGIGTQMFGPPGRRSISILSGLSTYWAPPGSVVYGLGGGAGGGPCGPDATPKNWLYAEAWGITFKWVVDGQITTRGEEPGHSPVGFADGVTVLAQVPQRR